MAYPVYSTRFICEHVPDGYSSQVRCPDDQVLVVKQLSVFGRVGLDVLYWWFEDLNSSVALWSGTFGIPEPAAGNSINAFELACSFVFPPAEGFVFRVSSTFGDSVDCYAGGYTLAE